MSQPGAVRRRLTDEERHLLGHLAAVVLAQQTGAPLTAAVGALEDLADEGRISLTGDDYDVHMKVDGKVLVHCTREWLSFFASHPDEVIDLDRYCTYYKDGDR